MPNEFVQPGFGQCNHNYQSVSSRFGVCFLPHGRSSRIPFAVIAGDYEVTDQPARVIKSGPTVNVCAAD